MAEAPKLRVLCANIHYLPGYKFGGSVRSIDNIVNHLGDDIDFLVVTLDRDVDDAEQYPNIRAGAWNRVGKAQVYYMERNNCTLRGLAKVLKETPHDVLYLNSFFDPRFTLRLLLARRLGLAPSRPVVLAPRGEFSPGAITLKGLKKKIWLALAPLTGLYKGITWQASTTYEAQDIRRAVGPHARHIFEALDLPHAESPEKIPTPTEREPGAPLRMCFLSRVHPKKHLDYALEALTRVTVPVVYDIYGPVSGEEAYWAKCQAIIARLPTNVRVNYCGIVTPAEVPRVMADHDLFYFPTRGENYGHVIAEAVSVGTPVLIADTTPWRGLEGFGAGWDLPLEDPQGFVKAIETCSRISPADYAAWRVKVKAWAIDRLADPVAVEANRKMFTETARRTKH